jgi:hypothetical protein
MPDERRRAARHFFSAEAELIELQANVRVTTRVGDLSLYGCYLDMMNPFPVDTRLRLKIRAGDEVFESDSRIAYAIPNVGAGATFLDVDAKDEALLQRWLGQAGGA